MIIEILFFLILIIVACIFWGLTPRKDGFI